MTVNQLIFILSSLPGGAVVKVSCEGGCVVSEYIEVYEKGENVMIDIG